MQSLHPKQQITNWFWTGMSGFFGYETSAVIKIHSCLVVMIYRIIQVTLLLLAAVWVLWFERGYQIKSGIVGGATVKIKGIGFTNYTKSPKIPTYLLGPRLWYPSDYIIPSLQTSSFFIMTNAIIVENQTKKTCPESEIVRGSVCLHDSQCPKGAILDLGNGILTGRCIPSATSNKKVCEIYAWCPLLEKKQNEFGISLFPQVVNITVMIKNYIQFPKYDITRSNILSWMDKQYFTNCRFNPNHTIYKYCPIFRVGDVVEMASNNKKYRFNDTLFRKGGFIAIYIDWECDLDWHVDNCLPKYRFSRLDTIVAGSPAEGFNFHHATSHRESNDFRRNDMRVYGIQFFIIITGEARKFEAVTFFMNVGSTLAFLTCANIICDFIVFNCTKRKGEYRSARVYSVKESNSSIQRRISSKRKSFLLNQMFIKSSETTESMNEKKIMSELQTALSPSALVLWNNS